MIDIIAELGSNPVDYNWNTDHFCAAAARAGATHVKIQVYRAEHFPAPYQTEKRRLEFPRSRICEFAANAHAHELKAGASVFDLEAVEICAKELDFLKLAAREQHNALLIGEVEKTRVFAYRSISHDDPRLNSDDAPFIHLWAIQKYPTLTHDAILELLKARYYFNKTGKSWGWSSHTRGTLDCLMAVGLGATVIEKHLSLMRSDVEGGHSLLPDQFSEMVRRIRKAEKQ